MESRAGHQHAHRQGRLIRETSHPTLRFQPDRAIPLTDDQARVHADPRPSWLITRRNRIDAHRLAMARDAGRAREWVAATIPERYDAPWRPAPRGTP
ncbi:MAG: hypothetical protein HYX65_07165 [Gemmatimonadetes bacterium]|nr:hypothetical protein [Gemmatimonadota bacterium]